MATTPRGASGPLDPSSVLWVEELRKLGIRAVARRRASGIADGRVAPRPPRGIRRC